MSDRIITEQLAEQIANYLAVIARDRPYAEVAAFLSALAKLPPVEPRET
jgi:hypothetical protein